LNLETDVADCFTRWARDSDPAVAAGDDVDVVTDLRAGAGVDGEDKPESAPT
jgi:hypothetical protein